MPVIESAATVGIPSSIGSSARPRSGIVVHYVGASSVSRGSHPQCRAQVRGWHQYHRDTNGWAGLGYHYTICHHGIVMTGRGIRRRGAHAPGANASHVGVLMMLGGSQRPTEDQLKGFREFRAWLGKRGVSTGSVSPHSRWTSTSCPGSHLRGRISSNNWGTGGSVGSAKEDLLIGLQKGDQGENVELLQLQVVRAGRGDALGESGVDKKYGPKTAEAVRLCREDVGSRALEGYGDTITAHAWDQVDAAVRQREFRDLVESLNLGSGGNGGAEIPEDLTVRSLTASELHVGG